jgi:hypothetical protein
MSKGSYLDIPLKVAAIALANKIAQMPAPSWFVARGIKEPGIGRTSCFADHVGYCI